MNQISRAIYVPIVMITLQVGGCASSGIEGPQLGDSGTHVGPAGIELDTAAIGMAKRKVQKSSC